MKNFLIWSMVYGLLSMVSVLPVHSASLDDAYKEYLYGDYQEAIREAQGLNPNDEVCYLLGLNYIKICDYPRARFYLRKLVKDFPRSRKYEKALVKLADTYFLEREFLKAKELYSEIKEKYPRAAYMPIVYLRLAQIAAKEGRWHDKREYLKVLTNKFPKAGNLEYANILKNYGDYFTIQIGAFSTKANALKLKNELEEKGYNVYLTDEVRAGHNIYKVRVGKFSRRGEVEATYNRLLKQGYPAIIYP